MNCPECGNETRSVVTNCLNCGWQAPPEPAPDPRRDAASEIELGYIYGGLMILAGGGLSAASYFLQRAAGRSRYALFWGLIFAGVLRILYAVSLRSRR